MNKDNIKSFAVLVTICIVVAGLMSMVNAVTSPVIEKLEEEKVQKSLMVVMPGGENFVKLEDFVSEGAVSEVYSEKNGGYVFKIVTVGYSAGLTVMCGIDSDGNITGAECISSSETLEAEKTYGDNFVGISAESAENVDTVSGATLTTKAYKSAIKTAIETFNSIKGANSNE